MSFKFQLPPITAETSVAQLKSYLMQMSEQLEYALNNLETDNFTVDAKQKITSTAAEETEKSILQTEEVLKAMIVKNAEIIQQQMDELETNLHGEYTAMSNTFGQYRSETDAKITANATNITQAYSSIDTIDTKYDTITGTTNSDLASLENGAVATNSAFRTITEAYIKSGLLYYEGLIPIYGVAVGQLSYHEVGGEKLIDRVGMYSVFTASELAFYYGETKIAYMKNNKLYVTDAEFVHSIKMGDWLLEQDDTHGFSIKWLGA